MAIYLFGSNSPLSKLVIDSTKLHPNAITRNIYVHQKGAVSYKQISMHPKMRFTQADPVFSLTLRYHSFPTGNQDANFFSTGCHCVLVDNQHKNLICFGMRMPSQGEINCHGLSLEEDASIKSNTSSQFLEQGNCLTRKLQEPRTYDLRIPSPTRNQNEPIALPK